jgi:hypothetical protein
MIREAFQSILELSLNCSLFETDGGIGRVMGVNFIGAEEVNIDGGYSVGRFYGILCL